MRGAKRLLFVAHRSWPCLGGAERHIWEWATRAAAAGYDVTVATTDARDIEYFHDPSKRRLPEPSERREGVEIRRFPIHHPPPWLFRRILHAGRSLPGRYYRLAFGYPEVLVPRYLAWTRFSRERFDLVHAGVLPHLFLMAPAVAFARRTGAKVVATPLTHFGEPHRGDGGDPHFVSENVLGLLRGCDAVTANTPFEAGALSRLGVPREKLRAIGPGVTPEEVLGGVGERFRQRFGLRGPLVLMLATQTHDKGSHHVVEAMKLLWDRGVDATLLLMGQVLPDFDGYFFAQEPRVFERTVVLHRADEQTKRDALAACDLFVMPSRADSFGIVYLEAWLYGKPVVGCFAGGVPDVIADGEDGLLVPFGDVHMLSETLLELLRTPPLRDALGARGQRKVYAHHTWQQSSDALLAWYREILGP